jgi:hypothetical protein
MRKAMAKRCAIAALPLALLPAFAAAAPPQAAGAATAHTQHVVLHRLTFQFLGKFVSAGTDRVVSRDTGRVAGFDTFRARERPGGMVFQMAFAFKGGILLARVHTVGAAPPSFAGRVTGGTGAYQGATGTVSGRAVARDRSRLTIQFTA